MAKLKFDKFTYVAQQPFDFGKGLEINYDIDIPKYLYKYYSPTSYNFDSLTNYEFFCSHPYQFNDITDSTSLSYDYGNIKFDDFKKMYLTLNNITLEKLKEMYEIDKLTGFNNYRALFYMLLTQHLGIVCLSSNEMHNLMWGYYASDAGFKIKYNTDKLIDSITNLNKIDFLFFPINYIDHKLQIDVNVYGTRLAMLIDLSTKVKHWKHENEWRLIISKNDMSVPNSLITPHLKDYIGKDNRLVKFDMEAIEEIVFGMNFFNGRACQSIENISPTENIAKFNDAKCVNFLKSVSIDLQENTYLSGIFTDRNNPLYEGASPIERSIEKIHIKHIKNNLFSISRIDPGNCKRFPNLFD